MIIMIKFRYYIDNQKEQDWLNKLSREGWALKKFFLGFYKFEKCEPGEYEYQIDLMPENVEQQDYYDFMEEAGVEVVCRWYYWVYLRRKTSSNNEFKLYSDKESLKGHYESIIKFLKPFMYLELIASLLQLPPIFISNSKFNIFSFIFLFILFFIVFKSVRRFENRIKIIEEYVK